MTIPKRLKGLARKKWLDVVHEINPSTQLNIELLCQYCECFAMYIKATETVEAEGIIKTAGDNGAPYQHPAVGMANKSIDQMRRLYKMLSESAMPESHPFSMD